MAGTTSEEDPATPHEDIEVRLSDYADNTLPEAERAEIAAHLAGCAACRAAYDDLQQTMTALAGMGKAPAAAPPTFDDGVADTIHRRSAGRFFGKKTLGDRVPFGVLLVIAMIVLGIIAGLLWSSNTGSLHRRPAVPPPPSGSGVIPTP